MRNTVSQPSPEAEARLLLLIASFSQGASVLEGRTKLAKLDFFLRYPDFLRRAIRIRAQQLRQTEPALPTTPDDIESRMVRYRYGPWDPQHFAILGRLIGKGLIVTVPVSGGIGYKATTLGQSTAQKIRQTEPWTSTEISTKLLKRFLNLSGTNLKEFVYEHFPEVTQARWGKRL